MNQSNMEEEDQINVVLLPASRGEKLELLRTDQSQQIWEKKYISLFTLAFIQLISFRVC